jgi:type II secretory pathway pseudopilin PulG
MKSLCFVLFLALTMPGCMFSKTARNQRAYSNYLKQAKTAQEKRRKQVIHQRAEMPSLRNSPPPLEQNVQPPPKNQ